jgi:hypothetical protein
MEIARESGPHFNFPPRPQPFTRNSDSWEIAFCYLWREFVISFLRAVVGELRQEASTQTCKTLLSSKETQLIFPYIFDYS